jgi:hypothetical protein
VQPPPPERSGTIILFGVDRLKYWAERKGPDTNRWGLPYTNRQKHRPILVISAKLGIRVPHTGCPLSRLSSNPIARLIATLLMPAFPAKARIHHPQYWRHHGPGRRRGRHAIWSDVRSSPRKMRRVKLGAGPLPRARAFADVSHAAPAGFHFSSKYSSVPSPSCDDCPANWSVIGLMKRVYQGFFDMIAAAAFMKND